jgi:hypothetical protein
MPPVPASLAPRRFDFERDTFAFPNELVWEYRFEPDGTWHIRRREPPPTYAHRCFVLARAARQFLYHARFEPAAARLDEADYRDRVRRVLRRSPSVPGAPADQVVFPGYAGLRDFSRDREALLKAECGGAWRSYVLRSHWRMVLPITRRHQAVTAQRLRERLRAGLAPVVHLVCFPRLTINHGMVLFAARDRDGGVEFAAYDPNRPEAPATLFYNPAACAFSMPANCYWPGGPLKVIEIFRSRWF